MPPHVPGASNLLLFLVLCSFCPAHAWVCSSTLVSSALNRRTALVRTMPKNVHIASRLRMSSETTQTVSMESSIAMQSAVDEVELIKIFGRLAEKTLFGDGSAGQCCHSGCSDCEWRYSFDILQSARPKWIPSYRVSKFDDGREHIARWNNLFGSHEESASIGKDKFVNELLNLKFDMPIGPPGFLTAKQAVPSQAALDLVWSKLSKGKSSLTPKQLSIRLKKLALGEDGVMWSDFARGMLLEAENEEEDDDFQPIIV